MKITTRFTRAILIAALIVCVLFDAATAAATNSQTAGEAEEEIKKLIVMITCQFPDGETKPGAGIIFGVEPDRLYIATAAHVVLEKAQPARDVQVKFRWLGKEVKANLLKHLGGPLDLAVLSVAGLKGFGINADTLPLERLGDPSFMQRGEKVYSMGNPGQEVWSVNVTPDKISKIENDSLYYESNFISPGHSGGALLNERWEVVGMIVRDVPPHGEAINITRVIDKLKEWGFPVNLRAPSPYVSAGNSYTCRVPPDGIVRCWSDELDPVDSAEPRFKSVSVGVSHACGIAFNGDAYCAGEGGRGQLGNGSKTNHEKPTLVQGKHVFSSISAGGWHTCGVTSDSRAYCWGSASYGRLGNDSGNEEGLSLVPVPVSSNLTFKSVSAGFWHTCGLTPTGAAYCWGSNGFGQLGDGSKKDSRAPIAVSGNLTFTSISAGRFHTCGVTTKGSVYCWGADGMEGMGTGMKTGSTIPVRVPGIP